MRPPSYYASIVKNNSSHYSTNYDTQYDGSSYTKPSTRTSNTLLRSSLSSPSSSSYASRSHSPFVPQSSQVAHSFTSAGPSSRSSSTCNSSYHYHTSPSSSYSPSSSSSLSPYYSSSSSSAFSSRPSSLKRSSHLTSSSSSASSYTSTSSSPSKPYLRPSYLSPSSTTTTSTTIGSPSSRPGYRPISSPSSYYQPIRLRERPLLTAIYRQLNRKQSIGKQSSTTHSTRNEDGQAEPLAPPTIVTTTVDSTANGTGKGDGAKESASANEKEEASWSSDITRDISRNKYLIKFREIDKQARPSLASIDVAATIELAPLEAASLPDDSTGAVLESTKRDTDRQLAADEDEPSRRRSADEDKRSRESVVPDREEDQVPQLTPPTSTPIESNSRPKVKKVLKVKTKIGSAAAKPAINNNSNLLQVPADTAPTLIAQDALNSASDKIDGQVKTKRAEIQLAKLELPEAKNDASHVVVNKGEDAFLLPAIASDMTSKSKETNATAVEPVPVVKKERRNVKLKLKPLVKNKRPVDSVDRVDKTTSATGEKEKIAQPQPVAAKVDTSTPLLAPQVSTQERVNKLPAEASAPLSLATSAALTGAVVKQPEPKPAIKVKKVIKRRGSKVPTGEDEEKAKDSAKKEAQQLDTNQDRGPKEKDKDKDKTEVETVTKKKKGDGDKPKVKKKLVKKSSTLSLTSASKDKTTTTGKSKQASEPGTPKKQPGAGAAGAVSSSSLVDSGTPTTPTSANGPRARIRFRHYNYNDFNFLTVLGHGGWGFVILAELKEHDACFAVKCIKKITIVEDDDYDSIMIERKVLTLGNVHPFICKLFCTFETEGYLFFVMEYCAGGDLMFHVQREGKFSESRCRFYAAEIICAIRFLHNRHIIYRDLKLDNILLDERGHIRLVDFGMCQCRTYREEMLPSNFCGTPEYISPEIIKGVPYNHSVDWWSFGVLLYEMAVGKMPFRGQDENELLWNVCYEQIHYPMFLSKELTSLLKLLLEREPTKRLGMATCKAGDIYDQPYFRGVDWKAVEELRVEPPFIPEVNSNRDVQNFDSDFTESTCELSPVDQDTLDKIDQKQFEKFPYTNPEIHIFDQTAR